MSFVFWAGVSDASTITPLTVERQIASSKGSKNESDLLPRLPGPCPLALLQSVPSSTAVQLDPTSSLSQLTLAPYLDALQCREIVIFKTFHIGTW